MALNIGNKTFRNLPEQVAENLKQIGLIWQKLDGLDVYDNVIVIEDVSNLNEEQLEIVRRPVSFIVYQDVVFVKKATVGAYVLFSPYYSIEADEYITIKSSELRVQFPLGEVTISGLEVELYDKAEVDTLLEDKADKSDTFTKAETLLACYPVGAIYISTVSTSPASLFGGTWEQLENRFLLGAGSNYSAGATGGEATHILTVAEMPSHRHDGLRWENNNPITLGATGTGTYYGVDYTDGNNQQNGIRTAEAGNNAAHNNMPPYLVVYMWKRVA